MDFWSVASQMKPKWTNEAMEDDSLVQAMRYELDQFEINQV